MKIGKLNFEQLLKFTSTENLMRVTQAYHTILRRRMRMPGLGFQVAIAEAYGDPNFISAWRAVIAAIQNPAHRVTLRKLADRHITTVRFGQWNSLRLVKWTEFGTAAPEYRRRACQLAYLIQFWLWDVHIVARIVEQADGFDIQCEADEVTRAALWRKSGMPVELLHREARDMESGLDELLPWVPKYFIGRVNPLRRPVNTPDVQKEIDEILVESN